MKRRRFSGPVGRWAAGVAAALALVVLTFCGGAEAACRVRLELDGADSPFVLTGKNALSPVGSTFAPLTSDSKFEGSVPRAWTGSLYAYAASLAACPTDRAGWVSAWPQFVLTSATSPYTYSPPLEVWPALHTGKTAVAGVAGAPTYDYNISDFRVDMRVEAVAGPAPAPVPSEGWVNFTAGPVRTTLMSGWISSRNSVTGDRYDNLANYTSNVTSVPLGLDVRSEGGRNTLYMRLWSLPLLYQAVSRIIVFSSPYNSFANFSLDGRITAKALLDCPSYCGDYGSCVPGSGPSSVCMCDCGWTVSGNGPQCIVPWGFCPKPGTNSTGGVGSTALSTSPSPSLVPSPSPAPTCVPDNTSAGGSANIRSVSPVNGACPLGYDWDPFGVLCNSCPAGFSGTGCATCNSDSACKAAANSTTSTCSLSPLYRPRTLSKVYTCDILDATVSGILGSTLDFTCNTTRPLAGNSITTDTASVDAGRLTTDTPVGTTPSCSLRFRLSGMPRDAAVICTGWACQFTVNTTRAYCPVIRCECPKGCSNAEGTITETTFKNLNSAVRIACGADAGLESTSSLDGTTGCKIELTGLPITAIPTRCKTAECIDPFNGAVTVTLEAEESQPPLAVAPIISWVPSMVLALVALTTALAVAAFVGSSAPSSGPAAGPQAGAAAKAGPLAEGVEQAAGGADAAADGAAAPPVVDVESGSSQQNGAQPPVLPAMLPSVLPALKTDPSLHQQQQQLLPGQLVTPACGTPRRDAAGSASETHEHAPHGNSPAGGGRTGSTSVGNSATSKQTGSAGGVGRAVVALPTGAEPSAKETLAVAGTASSSGEAASTSLPVAGDRVLVKELSWHGLTVATQPQRSWLRPWRVRPSVTLLEDVSGRAAAGEVLGILGPSGSGKTTLLSTLAGLVCPGLHWRVGGCVALDGRRVAAARHLAALVGHVPQHDLLARSLTVAECVAASAVLRMSSGEVAMGRRHMEARIQEVLSELGISHLAGRVVWHGGGGVTLTGGGGSGGGGGGTLSGGERLRVAAALELVTDPPLLLLDEPLSGLDSATARATMSVLRGVAAGGVAGVGLGGRSRAPRVVVMSLHQPSEALFAALDSVLLMAAGRVAYFGPPGGAAAAALADHLLDLVVPGEHQKAWGLGDEEVRRRMQGHWAASAVAQGLAAAAPPPTPPTRASTGAAGAAGEAGGAGEGEGEGDYVRQLLRERAGGSGWRARARRLWLELGVLAWRAGLDAVRNPSMLLLHLTVCGGVGLVVGGVFADTGLDVSGAQNRVGAIFFAVMLLACFATSAVDGVYPERAIVDRDLLRRSYGIMPYLTSRLVLDGVMLRALPAWFFALPFYFLMGLRDQAAAFFTFMGAFTTMSCLAGATCISLSFMLSSPGKAVLVMNLLLLVAALFSGFLANKDSIVPWLRWLVYVSPIRYSWEALVINELAPLVLNFASPDLPQGLPAVKGTLFLSLLGVDSGMLNTDLIVLGCIYAAIVLIAFAAAGLRVVNLRGSWK